MKRSVSFILLLLACVLMCAGKGVSYKDVPALMAQLDTYSRPADAGGNPEKAYLLICRVDSVYQAESEANRRKLADQGYTAQYIKSRLMEVAEYGLLKAYAANTVTAMDDYLRYYKKAPRTLRDKAIQLKQRVGRPDRAQLDSIDEARWQEAHSRVVAMANINDLTEFRRTVGYFGHQDIRQHDDSVRALWQAMREGRATADEVIRLAAPYPMAYRLMTASLVSLLKAEDYAGAYRKALVYSDVFGSDHCYRDLLRVLQEPRDAALKPTPLFDASIAGRMYCPVVTADNSGLYFCGQNLQSSLTDNNEDIFFSTRTASGWGEPQPLSALNASGTNESIESVSADGTSLLVFVEGRTYQSLLTADGWGKLRVVADSVNRFSDWIADATLTADGRAMLLTARKQVLNPDDPDIFGGNYMVYDLDIFVSLLGEDGKWGSPQSLGSIINTPYKERAAFLHPDMQTLYFTSSGHSTIGGQDIFRSRRLDMNSWTRWSEPENVGHVLNTPGDESFFCVSTDGSTVFVSSGEARKERLYSLAMPESMRPAAVATLSGRLLSDDGETLSAGIRWEDLTTGESLGIGRSNPADGTYFITLPLGHLYGYYVDEAGYLPLSDHIDLQAVSTAQQLHRDIAVSRIRPNTTMEIHNLFFLTDRADILPESMPELRRLAEMIRAQHLSVEIGGHADSTGQKKHNQQLSQDRADAVRRVLIEEGCDPAMLTAVGYGDTRPKASNDTEEGRSQNRRVEMRFL